MPDDVGQVEEGALLRAIVPVAHQMDRRRAWP